MRRPHELSFREYLLLDVNPVIRCLILSDVVIQGTSGFAPIFALFIHQYIAAENTAAVAGIAAAVYLAAKSLTQIPAAAVIDKIPGERDDFGALFLSSLVTGMLPLSYLFITTPIQLYIVQALIGVATACAFPSFMAIFTRHIDKREEGTEWGIYFTLTDLSLALSAALGGALAITVGYHALIMILVALNIVGALILLPLRSRMRMPRKS